MIFTDKTETAQRLSRVLRQGVPKYHKIKINEIFTSKFHASITDRVSFICVRNSFLCRLYFWYVSNFHCYVANALTTTYLSLTPGI